MQHDLLLVFFVAALAAGADQAPAQQVTPSPTITASPSAGASIPDFSGIWRHGSLPWLIPPASGPGPVTNRSRRKEDGSSNYGSLVGDYTNPILQPWAAEVVKKFGEISLAGETYPNPSNQCWPEPPPFLFKHMEMQMLQSGDKIVMLFSEDNEVRWVRMNQTHPAQIKPSWHGDAVGHYEGDTLVVDTVGIKTGHPYGMIDLFGTPYTDKLHVVERYRLRNYEDIKDELQRATKENWRPRGPVNASTYNDKYLEIQFTIEDPGTFTTPWTATMLYLRTPGEWTEVVCAENRGEYYHHKLSNVPHADVSDF